MRKRLAYFLLLSITSAIVMTACGGRFNKEDLKANIRPELSTQQREQLRLLSDKDLTKLTPKEREEVADVIFDYVSNFKWIAFGKKVCHILALPQGDKCKAEREECLEELSKKTDAELQNLFKAKSAEVKPQLKQFMEMAQLKAEDLLLVFEMFEYGINEFAQFDCGVRENEIRETLQKIMLDLKVKYAEKFEQLEKMFEKLKNNPSFQFNIPKNFGNL